MGKKKRTREENKDREPVYKTESGEPIKHISQSLYNEVTLYFSRIGSFLDIMEGFGFGNNSQTEKDPEAWFFSFAELGRTLLKDIERRFDQVFDFIVKDVGDIRIDSAIYGQQGIEGGELLKAHIKQKEVAVSGAKG
jgi:hypothetical protein